jgi:N-acetylglutamate synthase-like GNAT family acetyltransferase
MHPQVRDANPFDIPALLDMLRAYRSHTPLPFLAEVDDEVYITRLLTELMAGRGLVLVAEDDLGVIGMFLACIAPNMWSPKHLIMQELAYWVNQDSRGGTSGYRLLSEYIERGKSMKVEGRICSFSISKMVNSPDLKYERFGFTKIEETWVI